VLCILPLLFVFVGNKVDYRRFVETLRAQFQSFLPDAGRNPGLLQAPELHNAVFNCLYVD
jgi:hypothetical protein